MALSRVNYYALLIFSSIYYFCFWDLDMVLFKLDRHACVLAEGREF